MSVTLQFLVLVLSLPAVGLLLYVLTVVEARLLDDPSGRKRRERARHAAGRAAAGRAAAARAAAARAAAGRAAADQHAVVRSLAHRQRGRTTSSVVAEDREGEPNQRSSAGSGMPTRSAHG